jgi:hypothetical protein
MTYENIKFNKANMATRNGCFYMFDLYNDALVEKTSGGKTSFQYPLFIPKEEIIYSNLSDIYCLHYDGFTFWTLQKFTDNTGILIRQWFITNYVCRLIKQLPFLSNTRIIYDVDTFSIEYYNTTLSLGLVHNSSILNLNEYTDSVVFKGTTLGIGPTIQGHKELVVVDKLIGSDIYLKEPVFYDYPEDTPVTIISSLFIFNNFNYLDSSKGSILMIRTDTGEELLSAADYDYKDIKASKFIRLKKVLHDYEDVYSLAYVKGTSLKLRETSDLYRYSAELKATDYFDLSDNSFPDDTLWYISSGAPYILDESLYCSTQGTGTNLITSKYKIISDFDVTISGSHEGFYFNDNSFIFKHLVNLVSDDLNLELCKSVQGLSNKCYTLYDMEHFDSVTSSGIVVSSGILTDYGYTETLANVYNVITSSGTLLFNSYASFVDLSSYSLDTNFKTCYYIEDFEDATRYHGYTNSAVVTIPNLFNSGYYSLRLGYAGYLITRVISTLSSTSPCYLNFWAKQGDNISAGGPSSGEDLVVEYLKVDATWQELIRLAGADPHGTVYTPKIELPLEAKHKQLRLRFKSLSTHNNHYWFIDDLLVCDEAYLEQLDNKFSLYFKIYFDTLSNSTNHLQIKNTFFYKALYNKAIIFQDNFDSNTNWSYSTNAGYTSYSSKFHAHSILVRGNESTAYLKNPIDLSTFNVQTVSLYVWVQCGSNEWSNYYTPESTDFVRVEYYNTSNSWVELYKVYGGTPLDITEKDIILPDDALHSNFKLRFREYSNSSNADVFVIGDVVIYHNIYGELNNSSCTSICFGVEETGELKLFFSTPQNNFFTTPSVINEKTWYNIVVTVENLVVKVYVNQSVPYEFNLQTSFITNYLNTNVILGRCLETVGLKIDEFYTFNVILTDLDITFLMSSRPYLEALALYDKTTDKLLNYTFYDKDFYVFNLIKQDTQLSIYANNTLMYTCTSDYDCSILMGLKSKTITVSGTYFDYIQYRSGYVAFPSMTVPYYGIMGMDNLRTDGSTLVTIYAVDIEGDNLYRLQQEATYYGQDYHWATYNYQVSPIRPFIDFITVDSDSHIIPATGRNTTKVTAVVLDQYNQGVINKPVFFEDDDALGFMTRPIVYTDMFWGTGSAISGYTSGTALRMVHIESTVTQYD